MNRKAGKAPGGPRRDACAHWPKSHSSSDTAKYDAWNRLITLDDGGVVQNNAYDGLHRRIQRIEGSTTTGYYYNEEWQCLTETEGTGGGEVAKTIYQWHAHYIDALAARFRADGDEQHVFTHDANFNVTAAIEETTGDPVVERYVYTPYGECTVLNGSVDADGAVAAWSADADNTSDIDNEHLYTGRRTDPETGLQLNRNRFYHQQLGRWVNRDPEEYVDGYNLYEYVAGRPLNELDPSGLAMSQPRRKSAPYPKGPRPPIPSPWDIPNWAERRRGCTGNDSDHHCWAVCMTTYYTGCGIFAGPMRFWQDVGECMAPSPDWAEDILANEKGSKACAIYMYDPVSYCDKWCGTRSCR